MYWYGHSFCILEVYRRMGTASGSEWCSEDGLFSTNYASSLIKLKSLVNFPQANAVRMIPEVRNVSIGFVI